MVKEPTLFNILDQISSKAKKYEYNKKIANAYMISLWLSHDSSIISIVQKMNFLQFDLPDNIIYDYYYDKIPKKKRWLKWIKKTPDDKKLLKNIELIKKEYNVSKREAKRILLFMEELK